MKVKQTGTKLSGVEKCFPEKSNLSGIEIDVEDKTKSDFLFACYEVHFEKKKLLFSAVLFCPFKSKFIFY